MRRLHAPIAGAALCTALTAATIGIGWPSTGCYTNQCDPTSAAYPAGDASPVGEMVDENTYETSPIQEPGGDAAESMEPWIRFPGQVTLTVTFPTATGGRTPYGIEAYVGVSPQPNLSGSNFSGGAGALAEISAVTSTGFTAVNNTCALYYARFVVHFPAIDAATQPLGDASE